MKSLKYTLLTDGSSDKVLLNIIEWLLNDLYPQVPFDKDFADFRNHPMPPANGDVAARVKFAQAYYPFDVLFYHRDAEDTRISTVDKRKKEILSQLDTSIATQTVCLVPIKMMEAWLLIDGDAIKKAAGNRNYKGNINLPSINKLEHLKTPKDELHSLLKTASDFTGRRLKSFKGEVHAAVHRVAENITDFSPLRQLSAFRQFETDLKVIIDRWIKENE